MRKVHISQDAGCLAAEAAAFIRSYVTHVLDNESRCSLVLSGGNTPRRTYQELSTRADELDWSRVHIYWGDERCVPHAHPDSNYRMAYETLLSKVPLPGSNIHPMACDPTPEEGARAYEDSLRRLFPDADVPRFDLVLLGLGGDGHTASLFPGTRALDEEQHWVVANRVEKLDTWRLTLTLPVLNAARAVMFLAEGSEKSAILKEILEGSGASYPAQRIQPMDGSVHWFIDRAAGAELSKP
jgi:6-phosphogluconolactonase